MSDDAVTQDIIDDDSRLIHECTETYERKKSEY